MTAAEAAAHDRYAHQAFDIPERLLIENAARALALIANKLFPDGLIAGVAGKGNNGADTRRALEVLEAWGRTVLLCDAAAADFDGLRTAAVILDGILGTGSHGAPRADAARAITAINECGGPVIAVDMPSGVDATTGAVHEPASHALATVTFGFPKLGLLRHPARSHCGRLLVVDVGFPPLPTQQLRALLITPAYAAQRVPHRQPTAHKGESGRLLMLVGSTGMGGAAVISGEAAVRAGAGLVRLISSADNRELLQSAVAEATFFDRNGTIDYSGATALVAGCGLGTDATAERALHAVLEATAGLSTLLDADALNLLTADKVAQLSATRPLLITPHPKELSRLMQIAVESITADPVAAAQRASDELRATVLLKGQPTLIAAPDQPLLINSVGSSDFAVAGMGDQLAGVIGAMLAAGLQPREAAAVGLFFSGRAGDIAAQGRALTPRVVSASLGQAFSNPGPAQSSLELPFITFDQPARW